MLSVFITPCTKPRRIQSTRSSSAAAHFLIPRDMCVPGKLADDVISEPAHRLHLAMRGVDLEVAEAHERGRYPADDRPRLGRRVAVVEHVADHRLAGGGKAERARRRHAEEMHRLAADELAERRAQHGAAVGGANTACARPLSCSSWRLPSAATISGDRPAVAELSGPGPELVPAVAPRRVACRAGPDCRRARRRPRAARSRARRPARATSRATAAPPPASARCA